MGLETVTYIDDLVITNPLGSDDSSTSDDHHRIIKKAIKNTFPNITGPVTVTQTELNGVAAASTTVAGFVELATSAEVRAGTAASLAVTPSGLGAMLFAGSVAGAGTSISLPTGWTCAKDSTGNYTVTHSLALGSATASMHVVACPAASSGFTAEVSSRTTNSFSVRTAAIVSNTATDTSFSFVAVRTS